MEMFLRGDVDRKVVVSVVVLFFTYALDQTNEGALLFKHGLIAVLVEVVGLWGINAANYLVISLKGNNERKHHVDGNDKGLIFLDRKPKERREENSVVSMAVLQQSPENYFFLGLRELDKEHGQIFIEAKEEEQDYTIN